MVPRASTSNQTTAYSLSLLSEYTHTLDSLPLDLSRNFADLRELDAVLSSSMTSITTKIHTLTRMVEEGTVPKEERLWLLTEISEEATRLKLGGEDKIRVACQAADTLRAHTGHLRTLLEHVPSLDTSSLDRHTTYPHVAPRAYVPAAALESSRRRRGGFGSLLMSAPDPSPAKRKRAARDEDAEVPRSPRKEKADTVSQRPRNGARTKKHEHAASPTESLLSVTSHVPAPPSQSSAIPSRLGASHTSNRTANVPSASSKRSRPSANNNPAPPITQERSASAHNQPSNHVANSRRDTFDPPPTSSSSHPSLPMPFGPPNGLHAYDVARAASSGVDWLGAAHGQLEGPGMPVARGQSHPAMSVAATTALAVSTHPIIPVPAVSVAAAESTLTDGVDGEGDGDDKTYCFCDGVSYGEMIACDDIGCEREWFHLACTGLTVPPDGTWYCNTCRTKRNAKRSGRGGRRRAAGSRAGGRAANA